MARGSQSPRAGPKPVLEARGLVGTFVSAAPAHRHGHYPSAILNWPTPTTAPNVVPLKSRTYPVPAHFRFWTSLVQIMVDIASTVIAVISLVGTLITSGVSAWYRWFSDEQQRRNDAEKLISKYRDPLLLACQDLQSRLYNITDKDATVFFFEGSDKKENILLYTAFLVGQYFSWTYIIRRQAQFLRFSTDKANRELTNILGDISYEFSTDKYEEDGAPFMIWRGQQMAIGEIMTVHGDEPMCLGYASFTQMFKTPSESVEGWQGDEGIDIDWSGNFRPWFRPIIQSVAAIAEAKGHRKAAPDQRLRRLQHLLIDLINDLDEKGLRSEARFTRRCHRATVCHCSKCDGNHLCPCSGCRPSTPGNVSREKETWRTLSWRQRKSEGALNPGD